MFIYGPKAHCSVSLLRLPFVKEGGTFTLFQVPADALESLLRSSNICSYSKYRTKQYICTMCTNHVHDGDKLCKFKQQKLSTFKFVLYHTKITFKLPVDIVSVSVGKVEVYRTYSFYKHTLMLKIC